MSRHLPTGSVPRLESAAVHRIGGLSAREREVLALIAEGRSNLGIALSLFITERTVETHVSSILQKIDIPEAPAVHRRVFVSRAYLDWPGCQDVLAPPTR
jgi:DNA-binding NarL/FixJ family response regulator